MLYLRRCQAIDNICSRFILEVLLSSFMNMKKWRLSMSRFISGCIIVLVIMASSLAQSQDKDTCRSCCKEVYGTCKEGNLPDCDARYDKCLKKYLHSEKTMDRRKSGKTVPQVEEPSKTLIPDIPANPEKVKELKKQQ